MIRIIIVSLFFFLITLTFGQTVYTVDTLMKLKNVKTQTQFQCDTKGENCKVLYQHQFDKEGRLIKYIEYSDGKPFLTANYSYNKFNKADTIIRQFSGKEKYISQVFKFDMNGNIIEYLSCFENSGCKTSEKYQYNSDNKIISKIEMRDSKDEVKYTYFYDNKGNNTKITTYYLSSGNQSSELNYFDQNNQQVKSISYFIDNKAIDSTEYKYDFKGNLIYLNWMGGLNTKSIYTFDSYGNETEYRSVAFDNQINDHRIMVYKDRLIQTRIHYEGKFIKSFFKFDYEFY
jgi:hypothetical protein